MGVDVNKFIKTNISNICEIKESGKYTCTRARTHTPERKIKKKLLLRFNLWFYSIFLYFWGTGRYFVFGFSTEKDRFWLPYNQSQVKTIYFTFNSNLYF